MMERWPIIKVHNALSALGKAGELAAAPPSRATFAVERRINCSDTSIGRSKSLLTICCVSQSHQACALCPGPPPSTPRRVADTRGSCRRSSAEKDCITVTVHVHTSHMSLCTFARRAPASLTWASRTRTVGGMPLRAKITNPAWTAGTRMVVLCYATCYG